MEGKTVVITGTNSGIGFETAKALIAAGATVIGLCRNQHKAEQSAALLATEPGAGSYRYFLMDLSDLNSVSTISEQLLDQMESLDVLINNAGIMMNHRQLSPQGHELTLATNHLGHFLLTQKLMPALAKAPQGRIVVLSSGAHWMGKMRFDDLNLEKGYKPFKAYAMSKLANLLHVYELNRQLRDLSITVNAAHPGFVASNFAVDRSNGKKPGFFSIFSRWALTPAEGAQTSIYLASSPDVSSASGGYYAKSKLARTSSRARDLVAAQRLWELSSHLVSSY